MEIERAFVEEREGRKRKGSTLPLNIMPSSSSPSPMPSSISPCSSSCSTKRSRVDSSSGFSSGDEKQLDMMVDGDDEVREEEGVLRKPSVPVSQHMGWEPCAQAGTAPYSPPECFEPEG